MSCATQIDDGLVIPGRISLPFSYSAGRTASRFFLELRENRRIVGRRCPQCGRVWVPPQILCIECFVHTEEWVEVSPEGLLLAHTWVPKPKPHHPFLDPLIYGMIRLDGAQNNFVHVVQCEKPEALRDNIRVRAVFSEERKGHILDIACFRPI